MTIPTFTPPIKPSPGTDNKPEVKLLKAEFGDGYTQAAPNGIQNVRRTLTLSWEVLTPTQAVTMDAFLTARKGCQPFWYTPSDEATPVKWTCEQWGDKREQGGWRSFSATFKQSFDLTT